jgi:hypothetical protein
MVAIGACGRLLLTISESVELTPASSPGVTATQIFAVVKNIKATHERNTRHAEGNGLLATAPLPATMTSQLNDWIEFMSPPMKWFEANQGCLRCYGKRGGCGPTDPIAKLKRGGALGGFNSRGRGMHARPPRIGGFFLQQKKTDERRQFFVADTWIGTIGRCGSLLRRQR